MSSPQPTVKPRAAGKRTRRNFARDLQDVLTYCKVSVEILGTLTMTDATTARIETFNQIIKRLEK